MPIIFKDGDMFSEPVEALVNTVNCVGVMGKGVALEFKKRWPENFKFYKKACDAKQLRPGMILTFDTNQLFSGDAPRYLVNFPTKDHWRSPSRIEYIESGLDALLIEIEKHRIKSIAMPPLGCGNGGLDWSEVRPLILSKLAVLEDVDIIIFGPKPSEDLPEFTDTSAMAMTHPRAMLLKAFAELELFFDGAFDRISMQKIVYFLQALGVDFRLQFQRNNYGPYSESLKHAFARFETNNLISGFQGEESRTHVTQIGYAVANDYLQKFDQNDDDIITKLSHLIEGYESPYGLELLSSVHWLSQHEKFFPLEKIIEAMQGWNEEKRNKFNEASIRAAYERLDADGLIN